MKENLIIRNRHNIIYDPYPSIYHSPSQEIVYYDNHHRVSTIVFIIFFIIFIIVLFSFHPYYY